MRPRPELPSVARAALPRGVTAVAELRGLHDSGALLTDADILVWRGANVLPPMNLLSILRAEVSADDPGYVLFATVSPSDAQVLLFCGEQLSAASEFVETLVGAVVARAGRIGLEISVERRRTPALDVARFTWW